MEDQQPPGEAAMAEDQQKPGYTAMVEDQQKKPDEAAAIARYPVEEVAEAVAILNEITASLETDRSVRDGLLDLLVGFGKGRGDARAVASRVAGLLGGHPDVLGRFTAFITSAKAPAVPPGPLAVTRAPRSSTRKNETDGQRCRSLPAVKEEPDAQDIRSQRKSEAGGHGDGGHKRDDPRVTEAEAFLKRVPKIAGYDVWNKLLAVLDLHAGDQFADVIYGAAKNALGPAHAALLGEFASTFLPGKKEWEEQVRREARCEAQRNRRRAAAARRAADNQRPTRADDDCDGNHQQHGLRIGGERSGSGGTAARGEFDGQHATLEVVKKRRADGGDHRGHDDDNYAPRFRNKKPRADNGGGHRRHAVSSNGEPSGSGVAARVLDAGVRGHGDKKPRRRAPNGGKGSSAAAAAALPPGTEPSDREAMFRRFRGLWVFYTRYSTLVETMARVAELLHGDGGGFPSSVEELFPHREHRKLLDSYYGDHWGKMRAALEDGDSTGPALEAVLRRLKLREEEAVAEEARERRRNDAERAAQRLAGLVVDM
uniref:Histone deacetylase interacting domain-containing protein n=1 Tax=Setaria italica TaxID=4555 RepID=K3ZBW8_SETIT